MPSAKRPALPTIPMAEPPDLPEEIVIERPVIVGADWHVPHHDRDIIMRLVRIAARDGIKDLVIAGDFLSLDAFWMGGTAKRPGTVEFETELTAGRVMIKRLLQWFDRIYWSIGNHERRILRQTQGSIHMDMLKNMLFFGSTQTGEAIDQEMFGLYDRVIVTNRDYVLVKHGYYPEDLWRVAHGDGGSTTVATNAAISKADSYNCNLAQGHNHLSGERQTKNGLYLGADIGCCMDPNLAEYKVMTTKAFPQWVKGFATIRRGKLRRYSDRFTDWEAELPGFPAWSHRGEAP
jgi:hypothetical protein